MTERTVVIASLGAQGDGIAQVDGKPLYVPFTLPGERARVRMDGERGELIAVEQESPDRIAPVCPHFGVCGGCALQHLAADPYRAWKRQVVATALSHRGLEIPLLDPLVSPPASRRRARFTMKRAARGLIVGFAERRSHRLVEVTACPVLRPEIVAALPLLRRHLAALVSREAAATLTLTDRGLDVALNGVKAAGAEGLAALAALAEAGNFARLSSDGETIVERRAPVARFAAGEITLPPAGFLQATREGEAALIDIVQQAVDKAARVVDLFAGVGTFALSLPQASLVHAVESDAAAVRALSDAVRRSGRKVVVERRDLFRNPLLPVELQGYDAAIVDPPRAGAQAQVAALAASTVSTVVMISCNPATFARDARVLLDAGFSCRAAQPVDQFLWSPHVELAAAFRR